MTQNVNILSGPLLIVGQSCEKLTISVATVLLVSRRPVVADNKAQ